MTIKLSNRLGLHARAAGQLVATASSFESDIQVRKATKQVNAKSIMGILMLAAGCGTELTIEAQGSDAEQALQSLQTLIENRFAAPD